MEDFFLPRFFCIFVGQTIVIKKQTLYAIKPQWKMMCYELTEKERVLLYKAVLRLLKEKGAVKIMKNQNFNTNNFMKINQPRPIHVHDYLIDAVWDYLRGCCDDIDIANIYASLDYLCLIDIIYDKKNRAFKQICSDIARTELYYIDGEVENLSDRKIYLDNDFMKKIKNAFSKYEKYIISPDNKNFTCF